MNGTPDAVYEKAQEILKKAYDDLHGGTNNQLGMPAYLRGVAADFREAKNLIAELEAYALESAKSWNKNLSGNGYNSNATMEVGGRRRNRRKTRRGRKN
jgi:hypothetical protein